MFPAVFQELLSVLNARKVKYLLVGGYAVSLYAQPRATKDLDLLVSPNVRNAAKLFEALADFGAPLTGLRPRDFTNPAMFFRMGRAPLEVGLILAIPGVEFAAAWERRIEVVVDPARGLTAPVISRKDLMAAKLIAARPQDLADVAALRQAARAGSGRKAKSSKKRVSR